MRNFFLSFLFGCTLVCLTGCFTPTQSTIEFVNEKGEVYKRVTASESAAKTIVEAYKNHTIITYNNGWSTDFKVTMCTTENPFPTFAFGIGKDDKASIILHKDHDIGILPNIIKQVRDSEIKISYKDSAATFSAGTTEDTDPIKVIGRDIKRLPRPMYAWVNGGDIVYTLTTNPKVGQKAVVKGMITRRLTIAGEITSASEASIIVKETVYTRSVKDDVKANPQAASEETKAEEAAVVKETVQAVEPVTTVKQAVTEAAATTSK